MRLRVRSNARTPPSGWAASRSAWNSAATASAFTPVAGKPSGCRAAATPGAPGTAPTNQRVVGAPKLRSRTFNAVSGSGTGSGSRVGLARGEVRHRVKRTPLRHPPPRNCNRIDRDRRRGRDLSAGVRYLVQVELGREARELARPDEMSASDSTVSSAGSPLPPAHALAMKPRFQCSPKERQTVRVISTFPRHGHGDGAIAGRVDGYGVSTDVGASVPSTL